jgi:hypothetical protein
MIQFTRQGTTVRIEVTGKWPLSKSYYFYWECKDDDFASLLTENLRDKMHDEIRRIRQEEYNKGWKDAKSKKVVKETWFSSIWK